MTGYSIFLPSRLKHCTSTLGRWLPIRSRIGNDRLQYFPDMPKLAGNVRFSRKKTFPSGRLMTGMPQLRTIPSFNQTSTNSNHPGYLRRVACACFCIFLEYPVDLAIFAKPQCMARTQQHSNQVYIHSRDKLERLLCKAMHDDSFAGHNGIWTMRSGFLCYFIPCSGFSPNTPSISRSS